MKEEDFYISHFSVILIDLDKEKYSLFLSHFLTAASLFIARCKIFFFWLFKINKDVYQFPSKISPTTAIVCSSLVENPRECRNNGREAALEMARKRRMAKNHQLLAFSKEC
jgi:hypothetical protein